MKNLLVVLHGTMRSYRVTPYNGANAVPGVTNARSGLAPPSTITAHKLGDRVARRFRVCEHGASTKPPTE